MLAQKPFDFKLTDIIITLQDLLNSLRNTDRPRSKICNEGVSRIEPRFHNQHILIN